MHASKMARGESEYQGKLEVLVLVLRDLQVLQVQQEKQEQMG